MNFSFESILSSLANWQYEVKCFAKIFPFLLTVDNDENNDVARDLLEKKFIELQCEHSKLEDKSIDEIIEYIQNIRTVDGNKM